jgi:hypothetical protein
MSNGDESSEGTTFLNDFGILYSNDYSLAPFASGKRRSSVAPARRSSIAPGPRHSRGASLSDYARKSIVTSSVSESIPEPCEVTITVDQHVETAGEEQSLSILLTRQKEKSTVLLARAHGEIKRQKVDLEKTKAENDLLKEVLLVGCGMKFESRDMKEAVQAFIVARNNVEQHRFGDETAKQNSSKQNASVSKLKVLPPISAKDELKQSKLSPNPPETRPPKNGVPTRKSVAKKEMYDANYSLGEVEEREPEEVFRTERFRIASGLLVKNSLVKVKSKVATDPPPLPKAPRPPQESNSGPKGSNIGAKIRGVIQVRRNQAKEIIKKQE